MGEPNRQLQVVAVEFLLYMLLLALAIALPQILSLEGRANWSVASIMFPVMYLVLFLRILLRNKTLIDGK